MFTISSIMLHVTLAQTLWEQSYNNKTECCHERKKSKTLKSQQEDQIFFSAAMSKMNNRQDGSESPERRMDTLSVTNCVERGLLNL